MTPESGVRYEIIQSKGWVAILSSAPGRASRHVVSIDIVDDSERTRVTIVLGLLVDLLNTQQTTMERLSYDCTEGPAED